MKKVLLFAVAFILFNIASVSVPKIAYGAVGESCCHAYDDWARLVPGFSGNLYYYDAGRNGCVNPIPGSPTFPIDCAINESCAANKCIAGLSGDTISPQCPSDQPDDILGKCCMPDTIKELIIKSATLPSDYSSWVAGRCSSVAKTGCGTSGLYGYDPVRKTCVRGYTSTWAINNTCDNGTTGVQTAIGCIPTGDLTGSGGFLSFILKWVFGISGGIILVMIIVTGYSILTSSGNPEKLAAAKENVVSIFSGLILIAFSLVLLQTIGGNILGLPGF